MRNRVVRRTDSGFEVEEQSVERIEIRSISNGEEINPTCAFIVEDAETHNPIHTISELHMDAVPPYDSMTIRTVAIDLQPYAAHGIEEERVVYRVATQGMRIEDYIIESINIVARRRPNPTEFENGVGEYGLRAL